MKKPSVRFFEQKAFILLVYHLLIKYNTEDMRLFLTPGCCRSDPDFLATLLAVLAVVLVIFVVLFVIGVLLKVFFLNPIKVGCYRYMVMARDVKPVISEIMFSFKGGYLNVVKTMFLMDLYLSY